MGIVRARDDSCNNATGWRCRRQRQAQAIVEPLVIPFVVVVRDELADGATQRALADQDHALEAGFLDGGCFRHQLLLPRPYLVLTKPLRLDIQCQRGATVKIGWKYLDD